MKRQLRLRDEAKVGIAEAANFYSLRSLATMTNFLGDLDEALNRILESPRLYSVRTKNIRRINLAHFTYALWFEIIAAKDEATDEEVELVVVLRCFHTKRDVTVRSFD